MKKAVIFDLDGTLVNSLPDISFAMNRALTLEGLVPHSEDRYRYFVGDGVIHLSERAAGERKDLAEKLREHYVPYYHEHSRDRSYVYDGIADMLVRLQREGILLSVFTNKDQPDAEDVIQHYFPSAPFRVIQGRQPGIPIKPDPEGVFRILEKLGTSKEETVYVGDTATDMKCGRNAGLFTFGVLWGFRTRDELENSGAKCIVSTPEELTGLVLRQAL